MKRILSVILMLALAACSGLNPRPTTQPTPTLPPSTPVVIAPTGPAPTSKPTATGVEPAQPPTSRRGASPGSRPSFRLGFEPVASGFRRPLYVTHAGDGSGRLFVVE